MSYTISSFVIVSDYNLTSFEKYLESISRSRQGVNLLYSLSSYSRNLTKLDYIVSCETHETIKEIDELIKDGAWIHGG